MGERCIVFVDIGANAGILLRMAEDRSFHDDSLMIPVDREVCFSDEKNTFNERIRTQQIARAKKLEPLLRHVLKSKETVLYIARCQWPMSMLEIFTSGWIAHLMNQATLVVTSDRIILIRIRSNGVPVGGLSQIGYHGIRSCKKTGWGQNLLCTYTSGKTEQFRNIGTMVCTKLMELIEKRRQDVHTTEHNERHYLCPRCTATLAMHRYTCPNCNLLFRNPVTALKYGVMFPGGGFFYMRRRFFGFQYGLGELLLIGFLIFTLFSMPNTTQYTGMAIFLVIALVITKAIHIFRARSYAQEYVPVHADDSTIHYT